MRNLKRAAFLLCLLAVMGVGAATLITEAQAQPRCVCPLIYDPVICNGKRVFSNQCLADCRHAKDCVPLGSI